MHLTLVGAAGTKLVQASTTTWVELRYREGAREAVSVPAGFTIALEGDFKDATWETYTSAHLQVVVDNAHHTLSVNGATLEGAPLGVVTVKKVRYLAVQDSTGADVTLLRV